MISQEVGSRKPESAIFRLAATECDATLEHGWMVGDNPEADIKGAAAVRLNTIWVSAAANWPLADLEPGLSVVAIEDALAHLQGLPAA